MTVGRVPDATERFTAYLAGLFTRIDRGSGWCGVFWDRDPEGMRACAEGRELPPWDVVDSLLQDLARIAGPGAVEQEAALARQLHGGAAAARDAQQGAGELLRHRLESMRGEEERAARRIRELHAAAATATAGLGVRSGETESELAWAEDDLARARLRCDELAGRLARTTGGPGQPPLSGRRPQAGTEYVPRAAEAAAAAAGPEPAGPEPVGPELPTVPAESASSGDGAPGAGSGRSRGRAPRRRVRGSARFAGFEPEEAPAPAPVVAPVLPLLPDVGGAGVPRGARHAGAYGKEAEEQPVAVAVAPEPPDPSAGAEVDGLVEELRRRRVQRDAGGAHGLLLDAAHWPAGHLPLLAVALRRSGLAADWDTLLWEIASLPAAELAAAAANLAGAGLDQDTGHLLRQALGRPPAAAGLVALHLVDRGRPVETRTYLDALVRTLSSSEAAEAVASHPDRLVPLLLSVAADVSADCRADVTRAVRAAGLVR